MFGPKNPDAVIAKLRDTANDIEEGRIEIEEAVTASGRDGNTILLRLKTTSHLKVVK